ncbi:uncharacterized protein EDB93DRAFT_1144813 [Suillus bovinus]|uniref:uncharacterized protein n=1 Tax=Suillus bovinus TaxID=48563 RepID=UPI001B86CAE9|nr:uncharacterized protein EDB93DRAFT_1144813 [Suillus bovinus]KAG2148172.1 hypothetical protein EDB93DRAFT_1144813 [Suillus bovinus]
MDVVKAATMRRNTFFCARIVIAIGFPFIHYSHQGSLAYIGSDKAIADLPIFGREWTSGGVATFMFWRSAYLSILFSLQNRSLVAGDWMRVKLWGRDVSRE